MERTAMTFGRGKPKRKPLPTVLVICEDKKSGKQYLEDAAYHYRINVRVEVVHIGKTDPSNIIREGIQRSKEYDNVFCVIDRDSHPNWEAALRLAEGYDDVVVLPSYPCFEYWLILHFHGNRSPYAVQGKRSPGECCVADLKKCEGMADYAKGNDDRLFDTLLNRLPTARRRARRTLDDATRVNDMNPSTRLHELIDFFEALETTTGDTASIAAPAPTRRGSAPPSF